VIPRIIHQTWRTHALPPPFDRYRDTWERMHPQWDHRLYDDEECRAFVKESGDGWLEIYDGLARPVQRADLFRYLVVYRCGGLYADIDVECFRPVDPLLAERACVFAVQAHLTRRRQKELGYRRPRQIANCIFAAQAGHPFLGAILERVQKLPALPACTDEDVEDSTGPRMVTHAWEALDPSLAARVHLLSQIYWLSPHEYPYVFPLNRRMYARHHYAGTWLQDRPRPSLWRRWVERDRLPWPW
jgi:inositol phosphorylceramide mannosyltransferase catalytic subunit